jgi:hypothetical protein
MESRETSPYHGTEKDIYEKFEGVHSSLSKEQLVEKQNLLEATLRRLYGDTEDTVLDLGSETFEVSVEKEHEIAQTEKFLAIVKQLIKKQEEGDERYTIKRAA